MVVSDIDGPVVKLELQGACGSCPSSTMTMKMGLERRLKEKIPEISEVHGWGVSCLRVLPLQWTKEGYTRTRCQACIPVTNPVRSSRSSPGWQVIQAMPEGPALTEANIDEVGGCVVKRDWRRAAPVWFGTTLARHIARPFNN